MGLIICCSCDRQRTVKPIKKGKPLVCSNCGAGGPRVVNNRRAKLQLGDLSDKDGIDAHDARIRTMAGLKWIAEIRGYKEFWSIMQFQRIFRCKPNGEARVEAKAPTQGVLGWVRRRNNEYKKEMKVRGIPFKPKKNGATAAPPASSALMSDDDWGVKL